MTDLLAPLAIVETLLFALTMVLANRPTSRLAGEYAGTAFHLLLLPIIGALPTAPVGQAVGVAWVACDVVAGIGLIWTAAQHPDVGTAIFTAVRMAGHLFAAIWIALASVALGPLGLIVGIALAFGFAAYTLAAGRLPEKVLAVPGVLMIVWLLLIARHFFQ